MPGLTATRRLQHQPPAEPAAALAYWERAEQHLTDQVRRQERILARAEARELKGARLAVAWAVTLGITFLAFRVADLAAAALALVLLALSLLLSSLQSRHTIASARTTIEELAQELEIAAQHKRALQAA
jgi:hypothetical protein